MLKPGCLPFHLFFKLQSNFEMTELWLNAFDKYKYHHNKVSKMGAYTQINWVEAQCTTLKVLDHSITTMIS